MNINIINEDAFNIKDYCGYIYLTTNKINNKKYIGKNAFTLNWQNYFGSGININRAINKYGKNNFKKHIIALAKTIDELNEKETYYIKLLDAVNSKEFYNISSGGDGGNLWVGHTDEEIQLWKNKIGAAHKGRKLSDESKEKISENRKGKGGQKGELNPMYGKSHTDETRDKLSKSKAPGSPFEGMKHTEETKNILRKKILLVDSNNNIVKEFESVTKAITDEWRKDFPKPNGMKFIRECINSGEPFHNLKFIFEKDYKVGI